MNKLVFLSLMLAIPLFGENEEGLKAKMCRDLDSIKGIFEAQYAPAEWKQSYGGWVLEDRIESAKDEVRNACDITVKDYQCILRDFFQSTQDFHVGISFYSTESASLPFLIKSAQNRYFIVGVKREAFPRSPIEVGDEIISFNGKPIQKVIEEFRIMDLRRGDLPADRIMAEKIFTHRSGSQGYVVPQGNVLLGVKHKGKKSETIYSIDWNYQPERIKNIDPVKPQNKIALACVMEPIEFLNLKQKQPLKQFASVKKSMLSPYAKTLALSNVIDSAGEGIGSRNSFVPALGKKIWSSHPDSDFHAYLFETPDRHRYGYIRIPHYDASTYEFQQFQELIKRFEKESEALIIDQLNNPGGSMFYMYALLSTLTKTPLTVPLHRISLTQKEAAYGREVVEELESISTDQEAVEIIGDSFDGLFVTMDTVRSVAEYFRFIGNQWDLGIRFTSPYPLYGLHKINPNPDVRYTKPILVLINPMDFSCADFFPSILQDNKRATLLGSTTGGAGGFVLQASYPNLFGVEEMSYTGSIAYRPNNTPIENLGVSPDIQYDITVEDITSSYEPFKAKILESIKKLKR